MSRISRRRFLSTGSAAAAGIAAAGCGAVRTEPESSVRARPGLPEDSYDPWIELDAAAFRHNVREISRLAGGTPIMAVVKNNAYGLGDHAMGPLLASMDDVVAVACVRVEEAVVMREAGVTKPILVMAEVTEGEAAELVSRDVWLSCWLDDSGDRLDRLARRLDRPIPVHLFLDTGMGREGMPHHRALPWIEDLARRPSVQIDGTYTMFVHDLEFNRVQLARFEEVVGEARGRGVGLGRLHAAPTYEVFYMPEARFDRVRCASGIWGLYPPGEARSMAELRTPFRLRARVTRVEELRPGDGISFRRPWIAEEPTWIALLPVGHTDGYPDDAAGNCHALINGRLYPLVGGVNSAHAYVELGDQPSVAVGDVATLIGPDDPVLEPGAVAQAAGMSHFRMMTKLNPRLPRRIVEGAT